MSDQTTKDNVAALAQDWPVDTWWAWFDLGEDLVEEDVVDSSGIYWPFVNETSLWFPEEAPKGFYDSEEWCTYLVLRTALMVKAFDQEFVD